MVKNFISMYGIVCWYFNTFLHHQYTFQIFYFTNKQRHQHSENSSLKYLFTNITKASQGDQLYCISLTYNLNFMYFVASLFKDAGHPFYIKIDEETVEINHEFAYHIDAYIIR